MVLLGDRQREAGVNDRDGAADGTKDNRSIVLAPLRAVVRGFWKDGRWLLIGTVAAAFAASICAVAVPYVFSRLVDHLYSVDAATLLFSGFGLYAVLRGVTLSLSYCVNFLAIISAENLNYTASTAFFDRIASKRTEFFVQHNPAEIQAARENGERAIYILVQLLLMVFVPGTAQIAFSLILLGVTISLEVALIVVAYGLLFVLATYLANRSSRPFLTSAVEAGQDNAKFSGGAIQAIETLRYFGGDKWAAAEFERRAGQIRSSWRRWAHLRIKYAFLFGAGLSVQLAVTVLALLPSYTRGELSVGQIVLINTLLMQLNMPFEMIGSAIDDVTRSYARLLPFARIWCAPEERECPASPPLRLERGTIVFDRVFFSYGRSGGIEDVSFTAERGRLNFIIGETGSGKSTLLKIALKSLDPDKGQIIVDGTDLAVISREQWYSTIGVVPQETILLNDTVAANIALGRPHDVEKLNQAVARASLGPFLEKQPIGLATVVGERGLRLSGGERQRIAIARAFYGDPAFLFLDEASSALDEVTEKEIMGELRELAADVTVVAITHRKAIIAPDDAVVELGDGAGPARLGHHWFERPS